MNFTTNRLLQLSALTHAMARVSRSRVLAVPFAATLVLAYCGQHSSPARADATGQSADVRVGHTVRSMLVPGSDTFPPGSVERENPCSSVPTPPGCRRVDVHLWYPADKSGLSDAPKTVYTSALWGLCSSTPIPTAPPCPPAPPDIQLPWTPLSWTIGAEVAREGAPIDQHGRAFPVIVFSHGSTNDPIDYAYTLERIAAQGFVVAAPYHANNTQDDMRIDYINQLARQRLFDCKDGLPPRPIVPGKADCSKTDVPSNMADRVRDIKYVLDDLPVWFGDRVDVSRAGVMGHSRGTVTALAAAGGSVAWSPALNCDARPTHGPLCWPLSPDRRVKAVMGMAIGAEAITFGANLSEVTVPTLLVAGGRDQNPSVPRPALEVSKAAFAAIASEDKAFVPIPNATHRSFDSTYCAQMQAAAGVADKAPVGNENGIIDDGEVANWKAGALLDWHTVRLIASSFPGGLSGKAVHYCSPDWFTKPVWIAPAVAHFNPLAEVAVPLPDPSSGLPPSATTSPIACPTTTTVPCTRLDTEEVKQGITELAVTFFDTALKRRAGDRIHFTRYLAPTWLKKHVPMVDTAKVVASAGAICPPGQDVVCGD